MATIIGVRVDVHCDDGCDRDSTAVVVDNRNGIVTLERECCGTEVELPSCEFDEFLRDEGR